MESAWPTFWAVNGIKRSWFDPAYLHQETCFYKASLFTKRRRSYTPFAKLFSMYRVLEQSLTSLQKQFIKIL